MLISRPPRVGFPHRRFEFPAAGRPRWFAALFEKPGAAAREVSWGHRRNGQEGRREGGKEGEPQLRRFYHGNYSICPSYSALPSFLRPLTALLVDSTKMEWASSSPSSGWATLPDRIHIPYLKKSGSFILFFLSSLLQTPSSSGSDVDDEPYEDLVQIIFLIF